jgi:rSAM/selenodomain-associated transferase 2
MLTEAPSSFAVVVPTCQEATTIECCLSAVAAAAGSRQVDVVVSDSGCDDTAAVAAAMGARVIVGPRGRGGQLQRGAMAARGEVLLFLHADTLLPANAFELIEQVLGRPEVVGGAFRLAFDAPEFRYRVAAGLANVRAQVLARPWGDQAQFCRRTAFERCGGFPDWPFLEDVELVARLRCVGRLVLLPAAVVTSARRYRRGGLLANTLRNQLILVFFALGVSPQRLQRLYW